MEEGETEIVSVQAKLIRQMQADEGHQPCYGTAAADQCQEQAQCCWHHDCFNEH